MTAAPVPTRILVPLDGSRLARAALPYALAVKEAIGGRLFLARAVSPEPVLGRSISVRQVRRYLRGIADELERGGAGVVGCQAAIGPPAAAILESVAEVEADLIVMTTHGRRGIDRIRLGSVTESVIRGAPVPVISIRAGENEDAPASVRPILEHVLVPTDGSETAEGVLPKLARLVHGRRVRLTLLRVLETAAERVAPDRVKLAFATALDQARRLGFHPELIVDEGRAAERILFTAAKVGADLIAMGTHGRKGFGRLLLGSVAEEVLRTAPVPVLVVRETVPEGATAVATGG